MRYILVEWPESQKFMDIEGCILSEDCSYFVPEDIYYNKKPYLDNSEYDYGYNIKHNSEEL